MSKYDPSLESNPRDEMSCFVTRISDLVEEECRTAMLYDAPDHGPTTQSVSGLTVQHKILEMDFRVDVSQATSSRVLFIGDMNTRAHPRMMEKEIVNEEVRSALLMMAQAVSTQAQAMMAQATRGVEANVNPNVSTMTSRLRDFVRMNPPVFLGSKVGEDPQEFFDEVYKIVNAMEVTTIEIAKLAAYQLKDVAQIWFTQWKDNRPVGAGPIKWELFKK
uniref:Gag-pol protein n=1 Tax=Solanum tuberosum TaxID=4113 RepID=M1DX92_SOLTU